MRLFSSKARTSFRSSLPGRPCSLLPPRRCSASWSSRAAPNLYARTRDPERALENRLGRDEILAARLRAGASVIEISRVEETREALDARFLPLIADWLASDRGDTAARQRYDEEARDRQRRAHAAAVAGATLGS